MPEGLVEFLRLATRRRQEAEEAVVAAVFGDVALHVDVVANLHGVFLPATAGQSCRAAAFERPLHGLTLPVFRIEVNPHMRVEPLYFRDLTLDVGPLNGLVIGVRM